MTLLFGLFLCLPLMIAGQTPDYHALADNLFPIMDANSDGSIVLGEMEHFMQANDDDGDGRVSKSEYISHITWAYGYDENMFSMLETLYNGLDFNHDHHVDTTDFDLLFNLYDRNNDGQVTKNEFTTFFVNAMSSVVVG